MDGYKAWTKCHVRVRNDDTNPSDLTKVGTISTVSTAGRMTYIERKNDSTMEELISLHSKDQRETLITTDTRQVDHGRHLLTELWLNHVPHDEDNLHLLWS